MLEGPTALLLIDKDTYIIEPEVDTVVALSPATWHCLGDRKEGNGK